MKRPRMMAFWMEVALKVKVVAPELPTVMKPRRASPSSATSSSAFAAAKKAKLATVKIIHFMVFRNMYLDFVRKVGEDLSATKQ